MDGAWAFLVTNVLGKLLLYCGTTNLDAKPFLPAPEGGETIVNRRGEEINS